MKRINEIKEIMEVADTAACARELADRIGLTVESGSWYPVTAGELNIQDRRVVVNARSDVPVERVIAHEIAHYLLISNEMIVEDEEGFCDSFADRLLEDKRGGV